jgi:hypothetical protein
MRIVRETLEEELGVERNALKPHKALLKTLISEVVGGAEEVVEAPASAPPVKTKRLKAEKASKPKKRKSVSPDAEPAPVKKRMRPDIAPRTSPAPY